MPIDPTPFAEFGLAGLFGVFALVLTTMFLRFLRNLMEAEREQRERQANLTIEYMKDLNRNIGELNTAMRKYNGK